MGTVGSKGQIDYFNNNRPSLVMGYNGMLNIIPLAPRVAIGQKANANEFIIIVVDGRSTSSPGVNYYQLL